MDASVAINTHESAKLVVGIALVVDGNYDSAGVVHATWTNRAKDSPALWPPDQ